MVFSCQVVKDGGFRRTSEEVTKSPPKLGIGSAALRVARISISYCSERAYADTKTM